MKRYYVSLEHKVALWPHELNGVRSTLSLRIVVRARSMRAALLEVKAQYPTARKVLIVRDQVVPQEIE